MESRSVAYKLLAPVSTAKLKRNGTIANLVMEAPYLLFCDCIPPVAILNQILNTGRVDHGMSGGAEWNPFEVSQEEYQELIEELITVPGKNYYFVEPPTEITTYDLWWQWALTLPRNKPQDQV